MKAKELIELLQKVDPESDVSFQMSSGCCGDFEEMNPYDAEAYEYKSKNGPVESWLTIRLDALPGYHSCMQSGGTIRSDKEYWTRFNKPERAHVGPIPEPHDDDPK